MPEWKAALPVRPLMTNVPEVSLRDADQSAAISAFALAATCSGVSPGL